MASSIRASKSGLSIVDTARKAKGWNKSDPRWAEAANVSIPTLKRFWRQTAITQEMFVSICQTLELDWQEITDLGSANLEDLIHQGVDVWNEWKHNNPPQGYSLTHMDLRGMDLQGVDLSNTSLAGSNFSGCKLNGASLAGADLTNANFNSAELREANLSATQAIGTIFTGAMFTGACIENWNINSDTHLENITCSYVYLKAPQSERRPRQGIFKSGEFTALFKKALDTVDLIFQDGIDWQAFFQSFQELRSQYADQDLAIQAIEKKGQAVIVRLEIPTGTEHQLIGDQAKELYKNHQINQSVQLKQEIEKDAKKLYEDNLKAIEAEYEKRLRLQGERHSEEIKRLIEGERQEKATLMGVLSTMANKQSSSELIEYLLDAERKERANFVELLSKISDNRGPTYNLSNPQFAGGFAETVQGDQYRAPVTHNNPEIPSLAEAAAEIQNLLKQLEASNPTATIAEQSAFLDAMVPPTRRERFIGALQAVGDAAINEIPYGSVLKAMVEGWQQSNLKKEINHLLTTLHDLAQLFPTQQKDEVLDILDDLARDLTQPEPDQGRIGRRLKKLVAISTFITDSTSGAAAVSGEASSFTSNVIKLTEQLGIPITQVQLPPSGIS
ncbi:MAG: pentapeptide repeat-containing protein [Cyanobacteria bacterium P01_H01_bin.105]